MTFRVEPLTRERERDFFRLHAAENDCGWCFCTAWWVPTWEGWGDRTADENRVVRQSLFAAGEHDGYLLYDGDEPVGWCQAGPRDRLAKLARQFLLAPDPEAWAITCFLIRPGRRATGAATSLLAGVLEDLRRRRVRRVEAFPKRGPDLDAGDLWNGPESMFVRAGFSLVIDDPRRPVYALLLG